MKITKNSNKRVTAYDLIFRTICSTLCEWSKDSVIRFTFTTGQQSSWTWITSGTSVIWMSSVRRAVRVPGTTEPTTHAGWPSCSNISAQNSSALSFGKSTSSPPIDEHQRYCYLQLVMFLSFFIFQMKSFSQAQGHKTSLISISFAFSQTPANTVRPQIKGSASCSVSACAPVFTGTHCA